jgi:hypothetical protein
LRSFRLAVTLRLLVYGASGILLTLLGWWCIDGVVWSGGFWASDFQNATPWMVIDGAVRTPPAPPLLSEPVVELGQPRSTWQTSGPMLGTWTQLSRPIWRIFVEKEMTATALLGCILSALWSLAVWAFFGGAITRIAAVQLASEEQVGWGESLRWAASKWLSYFGAPLFPLMGIALAVLPLLVAGLLMRWPPTLLLVGLVWPLALVGGLVMAILLVGLIFGWPLMWATISVEGTDTFDALSRTYAYVFQRPLRYLFYVLVAAVLGLLGWLVVENFAGAVIWLAEWGTSWGSGVQGWTSLELDGAGGAGVAVMRFWAGWIKWLALGYFYSYFWTASTVIYYLLRRDVDATEMDEVFLEADESEKQFNLPPLATDAAGAPTVADAPAAGEAAAKPQAEGPAQPQAEG